MNLLVQQKLQPQQGGFSAVAVIRAIGGASYEFLINPEEIRDSTVANYNALSVLNTTAPLQYWQQSQTVITLPRVLFWTRGNNRDLSAVLTTLKSFTRTAQICNFSWGRVSYPRVVISSFDYSTTQWRNGVPTQATGSITLFESPELPGVVTGTGAGVVLSAAEQDFYVNKVRTTKNISSSVSVEVGSQGEVTIGSQAFGSIVDVLGVDNVRQGHKEL